MKLRRRSWLTVARGACRTASFNERRKPFIGRSRGLPGTKIQRIELQRASGGHPLDDVIVHALDPQGRQAILAIQVKRTDTFAPADPVFRAVMSQIAATTQSPDFWNQRYDGGQQAAQHRLRAQGVLH